MKPIFAQGPLLGLRLLFFIVASIVMIGVDHRTPDLHGLRASLSTLVLPIQYAVSLPSDLWGLSLNNFATHESLVAENARLRASQLMLQARVQKLLTLQQENNQLRALLRDAPSSADKVLVAQLLSVNINSFSRSILIDKGHHHDLYSGQPVLDAYGVIGQVTQVNAFSARVMLLTDTHSAIPVQDLRNGVRGILVGNGNQQTLSMINIPKSTNLKVGDELVTSGLGQCFPMGYPVGNITHISTHSGRTFVQVTVQPKAHLKRSRQFLLVWPAKHKLAASDAVHRAS